MQFAVNYSPLLADLVHKGIVEVDMFKCPARPEVIAQARELRPAYAHFPLMTTPDLTRPYDGERKAPVEWQRIDNILATSETEYINIHLMARSQDFPEIALDSVEQQHIEQLTESFIKSIEPVTHRYGKEKVIVENNPSDNNTLLRVGYLPQVIDQVIRKTGVGFLFDVSHAQLAARELDVDPKEYIGGLPTDCIREMHVTGLDILTENWINRFEAAGFNDSLFHPFSGKLMDHMPLRAEDWTFLDWTLSHIHDGTWSSPDIVTLEYGGIGGVWEIIGEHDVYLNQLPNLFAMVHNQTVSDAAME